MIHRVQGFKGTAIFIAREFMAEDIKIFCISSGPSSVCFQSMHCYGGLGALVSRVRRMEPCMGVCQLEEVWLIFLGIRSSKCQRVRKSSRIKTGLISVPGELRSYIFETVVSSHIDCRIS
jgi:hypothetical protein